MRADSITELGITDKTHQSHTEYSSRFDVRLSKFTFRELEMCAGLVPTRLVSLYHGPAWLTQHTLNTGQISPPDKLLTAPLGKLLIKSESLTYARKIK